MIEITLPEYFNYAHPTLYQINRAKRYKQFCQECPDLSPEDSLCLFSKYIDAKSLPVMKQKVSAIKLRLQKKLSLKPKSDYRLQGEMNEQIAQVMAHMRRHCQSVDDDALFQRIEHLLYLSFLLLSAKDNTERMKHLGSYLIFTSKGSLVKKAQHFLSTQLVELFPTEHCLQGSELRDVLDNWDRANESPLATKLRAVASYCMAFSLLEKWGLHQEFAEVIYAEFRVQKESKKVTSFIYSILDVVEFVLSRAKICYDSGSLVPLFHNSSTYLDWYAKVDEVRLMSRMRVGMEVSGFKQADYFKLLEATIQTGEQLVQFGKTIQDRKAMQGILNELKILRHESMIEGTVSKTREMPFAALVFGDSSIGKSTITEILGKQYARTTGLDYDPSIVYYRSSFDQYMSGYNSSKWMIVLDDIACLEPNKCTSGDLSIIDAIQLINCAPYLSNQAELEKKGKVPVLAKLVIANSNVKNLNVFHYFSHPSAVQRRFQCVITPSVRNEFRKMGDNGLINALDGIKAAAWQEAHPPIDGSEQTPDFWEFEITEWLPAPVGKEKSLAIEHHPFSFKLSMRQMLTYFEKKILEHLSAQATMVKNVDGLRSARVCGLCHSDRQFCLDRESHKKFDDVICDMCKKKDCMYLNNCLPCGKCAMPLARCRCNKNNITNAMILALANQLPSWMQEKKPYTITQNSVIWKCVSDTHDVILSDDGCVTGCSCSTQPDKLSIGSYQQARINYHLQGDNYCLKCGYADCLWINDHDVVHSVCKDCNHCISDEDLELDECVWCMVKKHQLSYKLQGYEYVITPFIVMLLVTFFSRRTLQPTLLHDISERVTSTSTQLVTAVQDRVENVVDSAQRTLGLATVAANIYHQWWIMRQTIERSGAYAQDFLSKRPAFAIFGLVIAAIASIKAIVKITNVFSLQGELKTAPETVDPWKRSKYRLSQLDLGESVHNMRQYTPEKFHDMISKNIIHIVVKTAVKGVRCEAFCVADRYYLVNAHNLPKQGNFSLDIYRSDKMDGVDENLENVSMDASMIDFLSADVAIMFLPHIPPRKNVVELFAASTYSANTHGFYSYKNANGTALLEVTNIRDYSASHLGIDDGTAFSAFESTMKEDTFVGLCGCPLVAKTALGMTILGFHVMGREKSAVATRVPVELLREYFKSKCPIDVGTPELSSEGRNYALQGLHRSSVFNFIEKGCVTEYGSLKGHQSNCKSKVAKTLIAEYLISHEGFVETHTAPVLKGWGPWRLAALPMVKKDFTLPYPQIKQCVDDYFECVKLRCRELHLLQKVSENVAINGEEGVRGVDRIDMSTSAGFPFNTMKQHFFENTSDGHKQWVPKAELRALLDRAEENYRNGKRNNFVFMGALKDEPREFKKVQEQNTRVFMGQNVAHLIIGRKYFLSFIRVMQRNRLDFECAIGTNAHSKDWDDIAKYLFEFSDYLFDGDYSKYDKEMMAYVIMCIFDGIIDFLCQECQDYTPEDRIIMRGVAYDIAFAFVNFNGDLVSFLRNNPSGHLLTVIINSICGSVYLRFGFLQATKRPVKHFREYVRPVTYGDDVVVSVHPQIKHEFNFTTYQAALAQFGMKFTPATKSGDAYLFRKKEELDFLKRSFVIHADLGRYVAPLAFTSIHKSLVTGVMSNSITPEKQIVQVMSSAWRESYMHGREKFNEFASLVKRIIDYHSLHMYVGKNDFPSYEVLTQYYLGDGSTAYAMEDPIDFSKYMLQGEGDRFLNKSTGTSMDSYCLQGKIDNQQENGSIDQICTGVPRNPYLGKDKLKSNVETSGGDMVNDPPDMKQTANHYETTEEHTSQSTKNQLTTMMNTSDQVAGEHSMVGEDVYREAEFQTDIQQFLRRPVEIVSTTLSTSSAPLITGNLFSQWANSTEVKAKLQNYAFIRGTICLKVQVDGSSFAYGGLLVNIAPGEDPDTTYSTFGDNLWTYHSQKQCAIIDFARNVDAELKTQLLMPTEWIRMNVGSGNVGAICAYHIFPLLKPQLATGGSTTIGLRVYAWMEDVEIHGATAYTLQGDVTIHSKENLAQAERHTADASLVSAKLSPSTYLPTTKSLEDLIRINPIVHAFDWDQTMTGGTRLVSYGVNPEIRTTDTTLGVAYSHPLSMLSRYFQFWRGSLKFTFKVFCSPHHAGTVRIAWDPVGAFSSGGIVSGTDGNLTSNKTILWNIRESDTCTFEVPHDNYRAWFKTRVGYSWTETGYNAITTTTAPDRYPTVASVHNGNLSMKVFTPLNSPSSTSSVRIIMQISAGNNFEFAQMCAGDSFSAYQLQGDEELYMGEKFTDIKKILARPSMVYILQPPTNGSGATIPGPAAAYFPLYPPLAGFTTDGAWTIPKVIGTGTASANAVRQTLMARLIHCHIGVAGSTQWLISVTGGGQSTSSLGYGPAQELQTPSAGLVAKITTSTISYGQLVSTETAYESGREIFNPFVNPIHEVRIPSYSAYRYIPYNAINILAPVVSYETDFVDDGSYHRLAVSAGPDFELVRFRGLQPQFQYPTNWIS